MFWFFLQLHSKTFLIIRIIRRNMIKSVYCLSYVYWTMHHCDRWRIKENLMSLAILFHFLSAQHISDINISIIRNSRLLCWVTTLVVLFLIRCVLEFRCGWVGVVSVLQAEASACNSSCRLLTTVLHSSVHSMICYITERGPRKFISRREHYSLSPPEYRPA